MPPIWTLVELSTEGDRFLSAPLSAIGGKGLFVKEIEQALLAGEADVAVHSLKDMTSQLPPDDRFALAEWIEQSAEVQDLRRAALIREIRIGLDEIDRGECVECKDEAELGAFFDGVKARGRELLKAQKESAA